MILEAVFGQIIGFGAAAIESGIDFFKNRENNRHAEKMAELGHGHRIKEYDQQAGDKEHERVIEHDKAAGNWLSRSVRPVLTYGLFLAAMYFSYGILNDVYGMGLEGKMLVITNVFVMVNGAFGYWFGNRNRDKMFELMKNWGRKNV